jgi:hypothetical protein
MSEISQDSWTPYSVGKRSTKKEWVNPDCQWLEEWDGVVKAGTEKAAAIARAGMGSICDLSINDRKHLFGLFKSEDAVIEACAAVIEEDLDLETDTLPRVYEDSEF